MILHNKSLYAFLGMMVMSLSLQAAGPDANKNDLLKLLQRPAGVKLDANGNFVARTKMDKAQAVAKTGTYAFAIGLAAHVAAESFVSQEYANLASLVSGLIANACLNHDVIKTIIKEPKKLKDAETLATIGAIAGGSYAGHRGVDLFKGARKYIPKSTTHKTI